MFVKICTISAIFAATVFCTDVSAQQGQNIALDTVTTSVEIGDQTATSRKQLTKVEAMSNLNIVVNEANTSKSVANNSAEGEKKRKTEGTTAVSKKYFDSLSSAEQRKLLDSGTEVIETKEVDLSTIKN